MGSGSSKEQGSDDDNNCNCFLFPAPRKKSESLLGTPLPQTFRKRSMDAMPALPKPQVRGRESSRYGGLEREVSLRSATNSNGTSSMLPSAVVHEGEVSSYGSCR